MHYPMPFYIRDLSIQGFWYLPGIMEPIPCGCQGTVVKFGGAGTVVGRKCYMNFRLHETTVPLIPALFKGPLSVLSPLQCSSIV